MSDDQEHASDSISISEEALNQFSQSDDSLAGTIKAHNISVRDFMLLSLVCDQECFDLAQLARALGLEANEVTRSVNRLSKAGLLRSMDNIQNDRVCVTDDGRRLTSSILDTISGNA